MAVEPLTLGFITLIKALCQQSFGLTLPQNCVGHGERVSVQFWDSVVQPSDQLLRSTNGGRFFRQLGLLVRVETSKEVEIATGRPDYTQKSKCIPQNFPNLQTSR